MAKESKCALNVRGFPKDLKWKCRQRAAAEQKTLGQFVESELRKAVARPPAKGKEGNPQAKPKGG
jgi:hypothetical protein